MDTVTRPRQRKNGTPSSSHSTPTMTMDTVTKPRRRKNGTPISLHSTPTMTMDTVTSSRPRKNGTPISSHSTATNLYSKGRKRIKVCKDKEYVNTSNVYHFGQFTEADYLQELESGKYGSVTKEIIDLYKRSMGSLKRNYALYPDLQSRCGSRSSVNEAMDKPVALFGSNVVELEDDCVYQGTREAPVLTMPAGGSPLTDSRDLEYAQTQTSVVKVASLAGETDVRKDKGIYVGVEDDLTEESSQQSDMNCDGLDDIWQEMTIAIECSKEAAVKFSSEEHIIRDGEECEHSFLLKDDIGYVCRICGVIQRGIETIIEFQHTKSTRNARTYRYEPWTTKDEEATEILSGGMRLSGQDFLATEISAHPRHSKKMKPHQVEGFNFLVSNLVTDNPGGCILAHAPGSGKTFMIISFIQSFMAKYPFARPLVILPRGILATWKKEFLLWQVEEIPLLDFYSVKADSRSQQLEVLKQWAGERSILFVGYKQFSSIVCDNDTSKTSAACQEILLTHPSLLILDEGHTPRNENTDQLAALEKVQTPRKVVLSGTLYQNHVKEVFNILNLVRPKFLRLETCKAIKRRILSRVASSKRGNMIKKGDNEFYELVEESLLKDDNLKRRAIVIQDLREMTSKVLHYYKGDFLDELLGLVDFTVFLNLSPRQKQEVKELKKLGRKFKICSDGSAIYVHPQLKYLSKNTAVKDRIDQVKIDEMLEKLDEKEGVKAKFYLNLLRLCESSGEKLLVFSQYLLPMKFLERLTVKVKGWCPGKEMFMITGDSESEVRESHMERFNNSPDARVFFGSIKACGEGISLVGASRIIILDVHLNPSVTRQAIGRAFRPGQVRKVYTYRLVAAGSPEEEDHSTCFRKESIAKLWFEWNECCGPKDFQMESADVTNCGDIFLETPCLHEDVISLYRR